VFIPTVFARIKETDDFIRIRVAASKVGAFVKIALLTSQRQILNLIRPAVLARDDVLDVKEMEAVVFLAQAAILTAIASTPPDVIAKGLAHHEAA
jgi:hypothetical protein